MKKYEVRFEGYAYPFKVLAHDARHAKSKVRNFLNHRTKAVKVALAKSQKLYADFPVPPAA